MKISRSMEGWGYKKPNMPQPKSIKLTYDKKTVLINWSDGHEGVYPFPHLRRSCPCAACKGERLPFDPEPLTLPSLPNLPASAYEAKEMFKVGNYAIGLKWGDAHESGIYTFDYLRQICCCAFCQKAEK